MFLQFEEEMYTQVVPIKRQNLTKCVRPQLVECSGLSMSDCNRGRKLQRKLSGLRHGQGTLEEIDQVTVRPRAGVVKAGSGPNTMSLLRRPRIIALVAF